MAQVLVGAGVVVGEQDRQEPARRPCCPQLCTLSAQAADWAVDALRVQGAEMYMLAVLMRMVVGSFTFDNDSVAVEIPSLSREDV